jgi:autotransporter-associated beta strand protein
MKTKTHATPFLRPAIASAIWLLALGLGHAQTTVGPYYFDVNSTAAGSCVTTGSTYTWYRFAGTGQWALDNTGTASTSPGIAFNAWDKPVDVNFVSTGDAGGKNYTLRHEGGYNYYISAITVNSGNLTIDMVNNPNFTFAFGNAALTVADGGSLVIKRGSTKTVDLGGRTLSIDIQGAATASVQGFSGGGNGNSAVLKKGTGLLFINGASDYAGATTVNGGTLTITNANALGFGAAIPLNGSQGAVNVTPGTGMTSATLDLNGNATFNKPITLDGTATRGNSASLINSSVGTTAVLNSGVSRVAYSNAGGSTFAVADQFTISGGSGSGATVNATLKSTLSTFTLNAGGSGYVVGNTITVNGGGATINAVYSVTAVDGSGAITGLGTLTTAGVGYTSLAGLTYVGAKGAATPAFAGNGATLNAVDGTFQVNSINMVNAGTGYTSAPTLTGPTGKGFVGTASISTFALTGTNNQMGGAGNLTITCVISGASAGFTKTGTGTLTLAGVNSYTGATAVTNGTLVVAGSISSTAGTTVTNGALFVNGSLAGAVNVASGATLGGTNTIAGAATLASGAILAPGAATNLIGTLTLSGTAPALSGRHLVADVSTTSGVCDKLALSGTVDLTGLTVTVKIPETLPVANSYVLLSSTALSGRPTLAGDLSYPWSLTVKNNTLILSKVVGTMVSFF